MDLKDTVTERDLDKGSCVLLAKGTNVIMHWMFKSQNEVIRWII